MNFKQFAFMLFVVSSFTACKTGGNKTKGGFQYEVLQNGTGEPAKTNDFVFFTAKLVGDDGKVINEINNEEDLPSLQIPEELPKGRESNPILDVFKLAYAKVGGEYKLIMPIDSIPSAKAEFPNLKHFEYFITVKKIMNQEEFNKMQEEKQAEMAAKVEEQKAKIPAIEDLMKKTLVDYKSGKLKTESTPSGLKYYIVSPGEGDNVKSGQMISSNYYGALMDGKRFDDSYSRGQEFSFVVGQKQVISGWDEGFTVLNKGAKAFLFIPYNLAYGEAGSPPMIPAKSDLVFYVELNDIKDR